MKKKRCPPCEPETSGIHKLYTYSLYCRFFLTDIPKQPAELFCALITVTSQIKIPGEEFLVSICMLALCSTNKKQALSTLVLVGPLGKETSVGICDSDGNSGVPLTETVLLRR